MGKRNGTILQLFADIMVFCIKVFTSWRNHMVFGNVDSGLVVRGDRSWFSHCCELEFPQKRSAPECFTERLIDGCEVGNTAS